jgi:hypothetical protein
MNGPNGSSAVRVRGMIVEARDLVFSARASRSSSTLLKNTAMGVRCEQPEDV